MSASTSCPATGSRPRIPTIPHKWLYPLAAFGALCYAPPPVSGKSKCMSRCGKIGVTVTRFLKRNHICGLRPVSNKSLQRQMCFANLSLGGLSAARHDRPQLRPTSRQAGWVTRPLRRRSDRADHGVISAGLNEEQRAGQAASAPPHCVASSARASTVAGNSRPSAKAVLVLITNSNLVGACTGKSAGFAPLRMRST